MITLAFYHGRGGTWRQRLQDRAIRWRTGGPMSHVELIEGRAEYGVPALCLSASGRDGGVREKLITLRRSHWTLVYLDRDPTTPADFIRQRIGARYDYKGLLLSQAFRVGGHWSDRWFCSEVVVDALDWPTVGHLWSPNDLFDAVKPLFQRL